MRERQRVRLGELRRVGQRFHLLGHNFKVERIDQDHYHVRCETTDEVCLLTEDWTVEYPAREERDGASIE